MKKLILITFSLAIFFTSTAQTIPDTLSVDHNMLWSDGKVMKTNMTSVVNGNHFIQYYRFYNGHNEFHETWIKFDETIRHKDITWYATSESNLYVSFQRKDKDWKIGVYVSSLDHIRFSYWEPDK